MHFVAAQRFGVHYIRHRKIFALCDLMVAAEMNSVCESCEWFLQNLINQVCLVTFSFPVLWKMLCMKRDVQSPQSVSLTK